MTSRPESPLIASATSPPGWTWSILDASRPRRSIEHLTQSEITPVIIDRLRPDDVLPDSPWRVEIEMPVIVVDTLDAYWVFERVINKLHGFSRTIEDAKGDLVGKLGGHLKFLSSLDSHNMAPVLKLELEFLRAVLQPVEPLGQVS